MQTIRLLLAWALLMGPAAFLSAQCVPDSLVPNIPGIYPDTLPEATGCQYYEEVVTFVFPRDTTVTVAGNTLTFPFVSFTIDSIIGLPDGLDWECNLTGCSYVVHPDSAEVDTVGCIRFFGTPNVPADYPLVVAFTAKLAAFGVVQDNPATYEAPLTVTPCEYTGACYTLSLTSHCEPAVLSMENEIPSQGQAGFSYQWQLSGPGGLQYATSDENPSPQPLVEAGQYIVSYSASIDTIGYFLDGISIDAVACTDLIGAADLYWILLDPQGNELVNTSGNVLAGGGDSLPYATGIGGILLDTGTYEFQVWDDDAVTADQGCATGANGSGASVFFTTPPQNPGSITLTSGGLTITLSISHPVQTVSCADTFVVDALPPIPFITQVGDTLPVDSLFLCAGDSLVLASLATDSLQWYVNGAFIPDARTSTLTVTEPGFYAVEAIDRGSYCRSFSEAVIVEEQSLLTPSIAYDGDSILLVAGVDPDLTYEWYEVNQGYVGEGSPFRAPSSGNYFCIAVDPVTGCASSPSVTIPAIISSLEVLTRDQLDIQIYPNPAQGRGQLKIRLAQPGGEMQLYLLDPLGRVVWQKAYAQAPAEVAEQLDLAALPRGLYLLRVIRPAGQQALRWLLR